MITDPPVPAVVPAAVPAGRMAARTQPVLAVSPAIELRPWRAEDAAALVAAGRDAAIRQWNLLGVPTAEDACRRIARMQARWQAEEAAIWAMARRGGEVLGLVGWNDVDLAAGSAEIVYWVLPHARGGGLVVEAVRRAGRWALDDLGLHRLTLCHSTANPASCRVADKAGYTFEGTMRSALRHADGWHDQHLHALVAGDL